MIRLDDMKYLLELFEAYPREGAFTEQDLRVTAALKEIIADGEAVAASSDPPLNGPRSVE